MNVKYTHAFQVTMGDGNIWQEVARVIAASERDAVGMLVDYLDDLAMDGVPQNRSDWRVVATGDAD
jgi:hypothetical protein